MRGFTYLSVKLWRGCDVNIRTSGLDGLFSFRLSLPPGACSFHVHRISVKTVFPCENDSLKCYEVAYKLNMDLRNNRFRIENRVCERESCRSLCGNVTVHVAAAFWKLLTLVCMVES